MSGYFSSDHETLGFKQSFIFRLFSEDDDVKKIDEYNCFKIPLDNEDSVIILRKDYDDATGEVFPYDGVRRLSTIDVDITQTAYSVNY